ncbi:siderophore-interacting protein [Brucella sp. BE17]|uniref:siderophore-interacting protein n=1 Tax=Brucella sp. BE17 TaxID=3142977 RepID=UPI0031BBC402
MNNLDAETTPPAQPAATSGPITRALLRWMMRPARIAAVETLSPRFRFVDLEGNNLKNVTWQPGQKVQVGVGAGFSTRTYTPVSWDADLGQTRLLAFLHGDGPGSQWAGSLRKGDTCQFFGPRRSLDMSRGDEPVVLFGDETSFALAMAMEGKSPVAELIFEVSDAEESRGVLTAIGLGRATVVERRDGDAHLAAIGADLSRHVASGARFVLTGRAQSIQNVSQALKKSGMASSSVKSKAYWSPGKTGLD